MSNYVLRFSSEVKPNLRLRVADRIEQGDPATSAGGIEIKCSPMRLVKRRGTRFKACSQ